MEVTSVCPFRVGLLRFRLAPSRWAAAVIAKGTFTLKPGRAALAPEQDALHEREAHHDDDPARSLHALNDLLPPKRRVDVVLVGSAFAPQGTPVRSLITRLTVGAIDKLVEVMCPRIQTRSGQVREGPAWSRMPLRYERAAGGPGTWNPVGVSADAAPDAFGQRPLPSIGPPGVSAAPRGESIAPIGFGPIASTWELRRSKLGRHAEAWRDEALAEAPLDEIDGAYFQAAPPDQQLERLEEEERIFLENLHPSEAQLTTKLSGLHPKAFVELEGAPVTELPMIADTLWIDTDRGVCAVTWRGLLPLPQPDAPGRVVIAAEGSGQRLTWASMNALLAMSGGGESVTIPFRPGTPKPPVDRPPRDVTVTSIADAPKAPPALPFTPQASGPVKAPVVLPADPAPPRVGVRSNTMTMSRVIVNDPGSALPAWPGAQAPQRPAPPPPPPLRDDRVSLGDPGEGFGDAARSGVLAASNAAAAVAPAKPSPPKERDKREPDRPPAPSIALELIWFDPASLPRVRKTPDLAALLAPPPRKPPPPKGAPPPPPDPPEVAEEAAKADFSRVLVKGAPIDGAALDDLVNQALSDAGALAPPLVIAAGELDFPFNEVELLKATMGAAAPLAPASKELKEVLDLAGELLKTPLQGAPEVIESIILRIRGVWAKANRHLPPTYLDTYPERVLLEQRQYQKRDLLDSSWICARFALGEGAPVPTYLPATLAKRLPLFKRFTARALVEVLPQQDQYEGHPVALRVLALGRVITPRARTSTRQ